ncbi:sigma-54-dependent transcriptional regulator [Desulfosarcina sp.]|uniref:sigma-54-dependent transcriptional regulator n=1 Tax=Desulfosarcina sp. TaxID=2027861 RepID=UPI00397082EE
MRLQAKRVLLVDDEEKLLHSIAQRLKVLGFDPITATNGTAAIEIATKNKIDMAIVDLQMPDMNGLVTITKLKEIKPGLKTVLLTGHGNDKVRQATESLNTLYFEKEAMGDFWRFIKGLNADGQVVVIHPSGAHMGRKGSTEISAAHGIEIHTHPGLSELNFKPGAFENEVNRSGGFDLPRIVGETQAMRNLRKSIARVAPLDCTVTLRGEPGTGKELAARAIHAGSMRKNQRFLAINCADFGSEQLAGQLLGYKSGNLYEAVLTRSGIFSSGGVGTLLFDRVEMLPANLQDQLLSIIDMADSQRTGGGKEMGMDIRTLVATDTDLAERVREETFRKTLYQRLKVFELTIPPLRERTDDIPPLCRYFFDKYRQELAKPVDSIAPEVVKTLVDYDFPGNVSELEHIIERAVILAEGTTIERQHLPLRFLKDPNPLKRGEPSHSKTLAEVENQYILEVLEFNNGNKSKTAQVLGISRAALWRKLKQIRTAAP